jgi:hypothetical protein
MARGHGTDRVLARYGLRDNPCLVFVAPLPLTTGTGEDFQPPDWLRVALRTVSILSLTVKTKPQTRRSAHHPESGRKTSSTHIQPGRGPVGFAGIGLAGCGAA